MNHRYSPKSLNRPSSSIRAAMRLQSPPCSLLHQAAAAAKYSRAARFSRYSLHCTNYYSGEKQYPTLPASHTSPNLHHSPHPSRSIQAPSRPSLYLFRLRVARIGTDHRTSSTTSEQSTDRRAIQAGELPLFQEAFHSEQEKSYGYRGHHLSIADGPAIE